MKKMISLVVLFAAFAATAQALPSRRGFRCTAFETVNGKDQIQLTVEASLSPVGTISSDVWVQTTDHLIETYRGASNFIGDETIQLDGRKTSSVLKFNFFGQLDPKNYSFFSIKLRDGSVHTYESKDLNCLFY